MFHKIGTTTVALASGLSLMAPWQTPAAVPAADAPSFPAFRYHGVVLEAAALKYRPHDDLIYPTVLCVDGRIATPLGKYYLYYAPHDAPGGICLAYADKPEGPWREYAENPVIAREWPPNYKVSHVSGPHALWNDEERKVFLYFHGENPDTRLATRLYLFFNIGPRLRNKIALAIAEPEK